MKKLNLLLITIIMAALSSCQIVGDVFKTGIGVGIVVALVVIFLIFWVVSAIKGKE